MTQLHQILAAETARRAEAEAIRVETINTFTKKADHFLGNSKRYQPFDDAAVNDVVTTTKQMITTVPKKLDHFFELICKAVDLTCTKEATNQVAKADLVVEGQVLARDVPATVLLHLESTLKAWKAVFLTIPTLDPAKRWERSQQRGEDVWDAAPVEAFRTKKVLRSQVLAPATDKHPANVHTWNEEENIGRYIEDHWSGAFSPAEKSRLLDRLSTLLIAVKDARVRANTAEAIPCNISSALVQYLRG